MNWPFDNQRRSIIELVAYALVLLAWWRPTLAGGRVRTSQLEDWDCTSVRASAGTTDWLVIRRWLRADFENDRLDVSTDGDLLFPGDPSVGCPPEFARRPGCSIISTAYLEQGVSTMPYSDLESLVSSGTCPAGTAAVRLRLWECSLRMCGPEQRLSAQFEAETSFVKFLAIAPPLAVVATRWPIMFLLMRIQSTAPAWTRWAGQVQTPVETNCSEASAKHGRAPQWCPFFQALTKGARRMASRLELSPPRWERGRLGGVPVWPVLKSPPMVEVFQFLTDAFDSSQEFLDHMLKVGAPLVGQAAVHVFALFFDCAGRLFFEEAAFQDSTGRIEQHAKRVVHILQKPLMMPTLALCTQCWPVFHTLAALGTLVWRGFGAFPVLSWALSSPRGVLRSSGPWSRRLCRIAETSKWRWNGIAAHLRRFYGLRPLPHRSSTLVASFYGSLTPAWLLGFIRRVGYATRASIPLLLGCVGTALCQACRHAATESHDGSVRKWLHCIRFTRRELGNDDRLAGSAPPVNEELRTAIGYSLVLAAVITGIDAVYLDADVLLLRNPVPRLYSLLESSSRGYVHDEMYSQGDRLSEEEIRQCRPSGRVDLVVAEHFHAKCLNSGLFYASATAATARWLRRFFEWGHVWPLAQEQNVFDASLGHSASEEPFGHFPSDRQGCPDVTYRLMDVSQDFLISTGGGKRQPWWEGSANSTSIHFVSPEWKPVASRLFSEWAASEKRGLAAEADLRLVVEKFRGTRPIKRGLCYYGRFDPQVLQFAHTVAKPR